MFFMETIDLLPVTVMLLFLLADWRSGKPVPSGTLADDEVSAPHIVADKADLFLAYATVPGFR